jgi:hypothetical protein
VDSKGIAGLQKGGRNNISYTLETIQNSIDSFTPSLPNQKGARSKWDNNDVTRLVAWSVDPDKIPSMINTFFLAFIQEESCKRIFWEKSPAMDQRIQGNLA